MAAAADTDSVETPYGWAIVAASLLFCSVAFGASYLSVVALKPVAAEFDWPRWVPSLAYSAILLGSGIGGVAMGHWADRAGVHWPALRPRQCTPGRRPRTGASSGPSTPVAVRNPY